MDNLGLEKEVKAQSMPIEPSVVASDELKADPKVKFEFKSYALKIALRIRNKPFYLNSI